MIKVTSLVVVIEGAESLIAMEAMLVLSGSLTFVEELPTIVESASPTTTVMPVSSIEVFAPR